MLAGVCACVSALARVCSAARDPICAQSQCGSQWLVLNISEVSGGEAPPGPLLLPPPPYPAAPRYIRVKQQRLDDHLATSTVKSPIETCFFKSLENNILCGIKLPAADDGSSSRFVLYFFKPTLPPGNSFSRVFTLVYVIILVCLRELNRITQRRATQRGHVKA